MALITNKKELDILTRWNAIESRYIKDMADHIRSIGKLTAEDVANIDMLAQKTRMEKNIGTLTEALMKEAKLTLRDVSKIYKQSSKALYKQVSKYYKWQGVEQVAFSKHTKAQENIARATRNLANQLIAVVDGAGKAMKLNYSKAIDSAIEVVASGKATYTAEINNIVKQAVSEGTKVVYPSGYTRRLDSSVRMNLLDGVRGLRDTQAEMYAQEYGADGVEIDAHGMCAEDHQPFQGKQYAYGAGPWPKGYKHFDDLDTGRPIGEYNCTHSLSYIVLGVSDPVYSSKELKAMRDYSNAKVSFGGKSMTRYEASQYMRSLETKMRDYKAVLIGGSNEAVKSQLKATNTLYNEVAKVADITPRPARASVPGYKG